MTDELAKGLNKYAPGQVIYVGTTDNNGKIDMYNVPYGTYAVVELRQDATIAEGDVYCTVKNNSIVKVTAGTDLLGKSNNANNYYNYMDSVSKRSTDYSVEPITYNVTRKNATNAHYNTPVRADFNFSKYDIEGEEMSGIPFMISRIDDEGNVVEKHVIITR